MTCEYCNEEISASDVRADVRPAVLHQECAFRMVAGSIAHLRKMCSCYFVHAGEGDPPGMTKRQGAKAALGYYRRNPDCLDPKNRNPVLN